MAEAAMDLLTAGDVAALAGISADTVRQHAWRDRMPRPALRVGRARVWHRRDIMRWLQQRAKKRRGRDGSATATTGP